MAKELRLGFAMGGGVSLGAFSGVALTEAIKLTVAHAPPDTKVVVDVFSGASAGAMSLALMLRTLSHPDDTALDGAGQEVAGLFSGASLSEERKRDLAAAHVAQKIQQQAWEEEITLDRLLGDGTKDLTHAPGILDRGAVEEIATRHLSLPSAVDFSKRRLLADRVLFAATLTNLTPLVADGTGGNENPGLTDGMTSRIHRDMRIFDIRFDEVHSVETKTTMADPDSWWRCHVGPKKKFISDLRAQETWARIAATSIAAGAFPFAFGPVVLMRKHWEFPFGWPQRLGDEFPFTYMDGGILNNEPIREAFRLASFLDAQEMSKPPNERAEITRRIIFVDPAVGPREVDVRVPLHRRWFLQEPNAFGFLDGIDLERKTTLERLLPTALSFATTVFDEANVVEADKIRDVQKLFVRRDAHRALLDQAIQDKPSRALFDGLRERCEEILKDNRETERIPAGGLMLDQELERIVSEMASEPNADDAWRGLGGRAEAFAKSTQPEAEPHAAYWLKALVFLLLDLESGLVGKRPSAQPIAIAPPEPLPGGALAGFAGFTSDANARYERDLARQAAAEQLIKSGFDFIPESAVRKAQTMSPEDEERFQADVKKGLEQLSERISQILRGSHLQLTVPGLDWILLRAGGAFLKKSIRGAPTELPSKKQRFEFRVELPDDRYEQYELDGKGFADIDIDPVPIDGKHFLITFAEYDPDRSVWEGQHLDDAQEKLLVDGPNGRRGIDLPPPSLIEEARWQPSPTFHQKIGETEWRVLPGVTPLEAVLSESMTGT